MRTVTENAELLRTSFDIPRIHVVDKENNNDIQRSCFYEFGVDNNEFLEKLWENQDDSIVADVNDFFTVQ